MDYRIRRRKAELDSTGYIEIGPGRYGGKHWQDGFLFVWEDAFGMAEGILDKHFRDYDHFSMNDIPKHVGHRVIAEWRNVADRLNTMPPMQAYDALNLGASYSNRFDDEIMSHRGEIACMLRELADACEAFYEREDWICVLGM